MTDRLPSDRDLRVSIVIAARNAEAVIARAIDSALAQDHPPVEIIVVDDGSSDGTADIVHGYQHRGVRLIGRPPGGGVAACRNAGVAAAAAPIISFLDAGDEWRPGKLSAQLAALQAMPRCSFVVCDADRRDPDGRLIGGVLDHAPASDADGAWRTLLRRNFVDVSCVLTTKSLLDRLGGFDTELGAAADRDLWIRLALQGPIAIVAERLATVHAAPDRPSGPGTVSPRTQAMIERHLEEQGGQLNPAPSPGASPAGADLPLAVPSDLESMSGHMVRGSLWMVAMRWVLRLIGLASTVILARLLTPADYGIVAMATVVVGFLTVFTYTNFDLALIQRTDAGRDHYDTAWTLQIIQGVVLAAVLVAVAPLGTWYFDEPRVELAIQVLALAPLIEGFANIGIVAFRRELDFAKEFRFHTYVRVINFVVTVGIALILRSYWALIIGTVGAAFLRLVLSFTMHPFRPRLSLGHARDIWSFSQWMLLFHIGNYLWVKVDAFIVGRIAGVAEMGSYHVASELSDMPTAEIVQPLSRALFPTYTRLARQPAEAAAAFLRVFGTVSLLCFPLGLGLAAVAPEMVAIVLGGQWDAAAPLVRWLAIAATISGLVHTTGTFLSAIGRQRDTAILTWINLVVLIPMLVAGGMMNGIPGVAEARTAAALLALTIALLFVTRVPGVGLAGLAARAWRPLISAGTMFALVFWLTGMLAGPAVVRLAIEVAFGGVVFAAVALALWTLSGRPDGAERYAVDTVIRFVAKRRRGTG